MLECGETDLDFYSRRAMEEAQAAAAASSAPVSAAHRHMAAAYSARLRAEEEAAEWLERLLEELDAHDPTALPCEGTSAVPSLEEGGEPLA